jgi:hypothetical protein
MDTNIKGLEMAAVESGGGPRVRGAGETLKLKGGG